jgi:acyl-CoA reductase-like NAD-dependent aldehyde dehydrogenase
LVLILAPFNYPLFLPGVQAIQALAAGNAVLWKPGKGGLGAAHALAGLLRETGLDERLVRVLPASDDAGRSALAAGPDKVLLTGSAATGRAVLRDCAGRLIPVTAELSGCDALFVLPGADLDRVARALRFGRTLNGGATCIAPRRVFVPRGLARELEERLTAALGEFPGLPVMAVSGVDEALELAAQSPFALGASIFGPERAARALARRVRAGVVTINDVIVPTADPRLPFGGRGESGFGVTRGAEGLLDLTNIKAVAVRRGRWLPHLEERAPEDGEVLRALLTLDHAPRWQDRCAAALTLGRAAVRRRRAGKEKEKPS